MNFCHAVMKNDPKKQHFHLKVYSMEGKKLFEAKEKSDMFMRQVHPPQTTSILYKKMSSSYSCSQKVLTKPKLQAFKHLSDLICFDVFSAVAPRALLT